MENSSRRILLVDDNADNLYMLSTLLSNCGYQIDQALNGQEALALAKKQKPDMLVSDVLMPVMDGFTLCRKIKTDKKLQDSAFIFYTAVYLDQRDMDLALSLGVDRYLHRPGNPEVLITAIQDVFKERDKKAAPGNRRSQPLESDYLQEHNDSLVRMLEIKVDQLDKSKKVLEAEIVVRRKAEALLHDSLLEKEQLLKAAHHHTRGNMQVILGLFDLQKEMGGHLSVESLANEMRNRIHSMSLLHDLLYQSKDLSTIMLDQYLSDLSSRLLTFYKSPDKKVELVFEVDALQVNVRFARPLGLVVTEIISNALKYAFPDRPEGQVFVLAHFKKETGLSLEIGDNGIGMPATAQLETGKTLGLFHVKMIVEEQLFGGLTVESNGGVTYNITLPDLLLELNTPTRR